MIPGSARCRTRTSFCPIGSPGATGGSAALFLLGRMKSGVTRERADAELTALVNEPSIAPAGALAPAGVFARERPHARARGQLAGARHGVGAPAAADPARGRLVRAPDRLRQRREPADGAPHRAPRRTVRPHGPRRRTPADRASAADGSGRVVAAGRVARRDARVARDRRHSAARAAGRAPTPRRHRDRRPRHDVLPRLVAGLDAARRARAGAARERGRVWRRPRAARRRNPHDGRPSGRAAADAAGRRADRDDARPADRRGPADSQLRASHVGVDGLRIEPARRRRADREGDAARTPRRRARTHPCVRARRPRSHPVPAGRDVREPDQLDAVRQDVHPGRLRHRGAAEADALCRHAEDRARAISRPWGFRCWRDASSPPRTRRPR